MKRSVYNHNRAFVAIPPGALRTNGAVNGTTVDRFQSGVDFRTVMFVVTSGAITDGSHAVTLEDSDNGSAWAAAAAGDIQGSLPTLVSTDDNEVNEVGYVGTKRYVRIVLTTSGATTGGFVDAVAILGSQPAGR